MGKLTSAGMAAVAAVPAWGFTFLGVKGFLDGTGGLPGSVTPLLGITTAICAGIGLSPAYFLVFGKSDASAVKPSKDEKKKTGEDDADESLAKKGGKAAALATAGAMAGGDSSADFAEVSSSEMQSMSEMDATSDEMAAEGFADSSDEQSDAVEFSDSEEMDMGNFESDDAAMSADEIPVDGLDDSSFELDHEGFADQSSEEIEFEEEPAPKKKGKKGK